MKNLEKLSLEKFTKLSLNDSQTISSLGGSITDGGYYSLGQNCSESYESDTQWSNGAISWDTSDFCEGWFV